MLDIHQLHVFAVAAETLNFTQAAQLLHMSQPSVSQHIQALERYFDTTLFVRNGRHLELSDAGLTLLPLAKEAVRLSMRIEETMASLKTGVYGHLIVGCTTTPGKYILPQLLARFHQKYPQVRVTCQVTSQMDAMRNLEEGNIHFALFSVSSQEFPTLEAIQFICDPIVLIAPLHHPWATRREIEPHDLLDGQFIMREPSSGTFLTIREALARHDISISDLRVLLTLGNAEAIALAVQEGLGVGFVSKMVVDRLCRDQVAEIKIRQMEICRQIYIGRNSRRPMTNAQKAFWEFLTTERNVLAILS